MSCRKAREFLSQRRIPFQERELFKQPLSEAEVRGLAARVPGGVQGLLATKGVKYKELGLAGKALKAVELVKLLAREPGLLKRPILDLGDKLVVGFDAKAYEQLGAKRTR